MEGAGGELAAGGREAETLAVLSLLKGLGLEQRASERLERRWSRVLDGPPRTVWKPAAARRELLRAAALLETQLAGAAPPDETLLARTLRAIDDQHPVANAALGFSRFRGTWMAPERAAAERGRERLAEDRRWANALAFEVELSPSELPPLAELDLGAIRRASARGVSLHGQLSEARLRRILTEALRAAALSYAATTGRRTFPRFARADYLIVPGNRFERTLDEAEEHGGIDPRDRAAFRDHDSFDDSRGWYTYRWHDEAALESLILFDQSRGWLGWSAQPTLVAGHVNWRALSQLGTLLPHLSWREEPGRTSSSLPKTEHESSFWRSSSRSLYGTRRFLATLAEHGEDPPWARSMVNEVGKIQDVDLLKTTLVAEYLLEIGDFSDLLHETSGKTWRVEAFEEALGKGLAEFESEWRGWLLRSGTGLLQRLGSGKEKVDPLQAPLLARIRGARRAALGRASSPEVWLDADLSLGAHLHAAYLARHPDQQAVWPEAHEEYADRDGFTPAGAWAGNHSVIYVGDPPDAVENWMATFFHRLPLLDPGLLGIGLGAEGEVVVGDVLSLVAPVVEETWIVWPPDGARNVPLASYPELPPPVPGRRTAELGYPVTLQIHGRDVAPGARFELELRRGGLGGRPVASYVSTPTRPLNESLTPPGAFCLLPEEHLDPRTRYTVVARRVTPAPRELVWSFETGSSGSARGTGR